MERNGRMRVRGKMGEKVEGIKREALPYAVTFSFPPLVIMIMQMITWFFYFSFAIMLK